MSAARRATWAALAVGLILAAALLVRPLAYGVSRGAVATFWAFVLLGVGFPGVALCGAAGLYRRDPVLLLGQGLTLGLALHGLLLLAGRAIGVEGLAYLPPSLAVGALAVVVRRRNRSHESDGLPGADAGLPLVALVGCLMQPLATLHLLGTPIPVDLFYHAGNAAELLHRWPLQDPRVAGLPLNYPVMAYALPVEGSRLSGMPVFDALHGISPLFWIGLLALQTHNAGRVLLGDGVSAALGTTVLLLHEDVGGLLGFGRGAFVSAMATAIYGSPTTVCGLILLAAMAIVIIEILAHPARLRALSPLLVVFAVAASLTKATVVPVIAGSCLLVAAWAGVRRHAEPARAALICAMLLGVGAAPFTIRLGAGESSYRGILRWDPGAIVRQSPFAHGAARALGVPGATGETPPPGWLTAALTPAWLVGYLGLAGIGALVFLLWRREALTEAQIFALGVTVTGALPALLLDAHGFSQLFFLYNGQLMLGILAGGAMARALRSRPAPLGPLIALGLAALPSLDKAGRVLLLRPGQDYAAARRTRDGRTEDYASALSWLRIHAARDAVVFADNPSLLLSALGECRLYYETGLFTPRGWERRWEGASEPYPDRAAFQGELLRRPGSEGVAAARRLFPPPVELLVVADNVQSRIEAGFLEVAIGAVPARPLLPPPRFNPVFANRVMHVYRMVGSPNPDPRAPNEPVER